VTEDLLTGQLRLTIEEDDGCFRLLNSEIEYDEVADEEYAHSRDPAAACARGSRTVNVCFDRDGCRATVRAEGAMRCSGSGNQFLLSHRLAVELDGVPFFEQTREKEILRT
jgi:hypothetical protein